MQKLTEIPLWSTRYSLHSMKTLKLRFVDTALDDALSLSCVVGVLLNNSHMVFGPYLNGQSNLAEIALHSTVAGAQAGKLNPKP